MSDGKNVTNKHPPVGNINYDNIEVIVFVKVEPKKVIEYISIVIKQNNYIYLYLQTISSHLSHIEERFLPR